MCYFHGTAPKVSEVKEVPTAVLGEDIIHLAVLQKFDSNTGNGHNIKTS